MEVLKERRALLGAEIDRLRSDTPDDKWPEVKPIRDKKIEEYVGLCEQINPLSGFGINAPRYDVMIGFNSGQWWVYDNYLDAFIDPPISILERMDELEEEYPDEDDSLANASQWLFDNLNGISGDEDIAWAGDRDYTFFDPDFEI